MIQVDLSVGSEYNKDDIENIFKTQFGSRIKGITQRRWSDGTQYIILFSRAHGPYSDRIEGDILYYDGEGQNKDQIETAANRGLMLANERSTPIFGFREDDKGGFYKYLGILTVLNWEYVRKDQFMVYEFALKFDALSPDESYQQYEQLMHDDTPPILEEPSAMTSSKRKARSYAFGRGIKEIYQNQCAVCGISRFTNAGHPEVESAHIYPKSKNGADDLRNGIALCRLHHWALDGGLFAIKDDLSIIIKDWIRGDPNYDEITRFEGNKLRKNDDERYQPDPLYLREHRRIHGFER